jgi:predicted adenine nucleotide alpha hydrolase (AANH) superfamily ATPase
VTTAVKGQPRLLLHLCCGPCGTAVVEQLSPDYDLTLYWFNPNIQPAEEFALRLAAAQELAGRLGLTLHVQTGGEDDFAEVARGLEASPEGGERCRKCYELRLRQAMQAAREQDIPLVATTLSISPHKSAATLNEIGERLADKLGVHFLAADFQHDGGFARSVELSKEFGLYRQKYCGCLFSRRQQ